MNYEKFLKDLDQTHILQAYSKGSPEDKKALQQQIDRLNVTYPGGLQSYYERALQLLKNSAQSVNPYEDYHIGKPNGINFHLEKPEEIEHFEIIGLKQFNHAAFVLVAGGLGQRLGYPGIKVSIPFELLTRKRFMHYYIDYILAYQEKFCDKGVKIPLAIMTSDDTHQQTVELLEKNEYFGMEKDQITIMKQQKVPAMLDNSAHFALQKDKLLIDTKPHGHGDVHTLLYQHKLIQTWHKQGKKWVIFFQDTNPLVFRSYAMLLGVSKQKDFDFNSIATPRKPGEAVGAITTLVHKNDENKKLIINVEYNMLEGLFKQMGGQPKDQQGYSLYPGNINSFAIKISSYNDALNNTKGHISEFINPKYADETKTTFKSSARLECLMQDYPKLLPNCDKVGFTDIPKGLCFSTVKNDLKTAVDKVKKGLSGESASTCEAEFNYFNRVMLRMCGAQIEECEPVQAGEIKLPLFPMIYLSPHFATCYTELKGKVKKLKVTARSSLVISSDCILQDVQVDGHDEIIEDGSICLKVDDQSYKQIIPLKGDQEPYLLIRGYDLS